MQIGQGGTFWDRCQESVKSDQLIDMLIRHKSARDCTVIAAAYTDIRLTKLEFTLGRVEWGRTDPMAPDPHFWDKDQCISPPPTYRVEIWNYQISLLRGFQPILNQ